MKRMFFEWAWWQFEAGKTRMGLTTLDIIGLYILEDPRIIFVKPYVKHMLSLVGRGVMPGGNLKGLK